jgi:glyoxylase-like metal-dependent hydrolase (beta-lactamase superfamily II)
MTSVHGIFDPASSTMTYVVWDTHTRDAIVIDPVLDYDPATQTTSQGNIGKLKWFVNSQELVVRWIVDTHAHADHLSGGSILKGVWPSALWGVSAAMGQVFANFQRVFAWPKSVELKKMGVDRWFHDGEEFTAGPIRVSCLATPGHTPACMTYKIGGAIFTGDALMMPDAGTGRCDFPGGSAAALYDSIWGKLYSLPDSTEVYVGHDYQPGGRALRFHSTIGEEKRSNIHLRIGTSKADFVVFREARDKTLTAPRLLNPSLDWNLGAHQVVKPL